MCESTGRQADAAAIAFAFPAALREDVLDEKQLSGA